MAQKKKTTATKKRKSNASGKEIKQGANYKAEYEQHKKHINQISAIVLFSVGVLILSVVLIPGTNIWLWCHNAMYGLFGSIAFLLPVIFIFIAILTGLDKSSGEIKNKIWESIVLVAIVCGIVEICFGNPVFPIENVNPMQAFIKMFNKGITLNGGGVFSLIFGWTLRFACGDVGAIIIMFLALFVFIMLITGTTLIGLFKGVSAPVKKMEENYVQKRELKEQQESKFNIDVDLGPESKLPNHPVLSPKPSKEDLITFEKQDIAEKTKLLKDRTAALKQDKEPTKQVDELVEKALSNSSVVKNEQVIQAPTALNEPVFDSNDKSKLYTDNENNINKYVIPPVSLLKSPKAGNNEDVSSELRANADLLVDTLKSFGVQTKVIDISRGPTVTRYELQPSVGVKISKITGLADDIALNLAAAGVRIEAPIPNKAAVGIEVPNQKTDIVTLREIIDSNEFKKAKSSVTMALGKDIEGNPTVADIAKMPHMLIAGATGSGKSVCINSIIMSLIYKSSPADVRLMMIDPKVVELGVYNGIPHLLIPVVTDPRKAAGTLAWAVTEMLKRYKLFADNSVRDLTGYNELAKTQEDIEPLPQIVIIIDELADLMMAAPSEVEDSICRLAQMARAAGMHLIIATQRPSVDVITGIIKANIPSRIAFAVSSQVDSRTILDGGGAEKLLGRGDMLFYPSGTPKPVRIQGCFVSDKEVEKVVEFVKNKETADYDEKIMEEIEKQAVKEKSSTGSTDNSNDCDELFNEAIEFSVEAGQTSTSYLQRRLKIGYARAARLIDDMEAKGLVGPFEGSKPRPVLISKQQWYEMKLAQDTSDNNN